MVIRMHLTFKHLKTYDWFPAQTQDFQAFKPPTAETPSLNIMLGNNKQSKVPNIAIPLTLPSACVGNWHRKLGSCHLLCRTSWNDQAMSEPYCIFTYIHMPPLQAPALLPTNCYVTKLLVSHAANHMSCNVGIDGAWRGGCWHVYFILVCILNPQYVGLCPQTYLAERLKLGLAEHHLRGPLTVSKMQTKKQLWKPPSCELNVLISAMFKTFLTFHYTWLVRRDHHNSLV